MIGLIDRSQNATPRYEFGFGLTYTTFSYTNLLTLKPAANTSPTAPSRISEGGQESLWEVIATVTATITNTGDVTAKEVAQLYIHIPGGPVKQLRGFEKVEIVPGETRDVRFELTRKDLSVWSVERQDWVLQKGRYGVWVGGSSRDLPLQGELVIG
jgi:beta-glucosidase